MLKLSSPAKVNLFLKVVRRRDDGFHDIVSLFQTISLEDRLTFSFSEKDKVSCSDPSIPTDGRNLVNKARDLFRKKTGTDATFDIAIEKNIPAEAGLGGGSSNAATTLWALNTLAGNPATHDELREWASELGSDVAFFLSHGTALCTGRGEKIKELPPLPQQDIWIVKPHYGLSTPLVYKTLDPTTITPCDAESLISNFYNNNPQYVNDLETPAFTITPELSALKDTLLANDYDAVLMSGSGTSIFCIGNTTPPTIPNTTTFKTTFINRSTDSWY